MIELLLVAERLLAEGDLERAEHLFAQVAEADPRNAIAIVGLARVARSQGDRAGALERARQALLIDPDEVAAQHLMVELTDGAVDSDVAAAVMFESGSEPAKAAIRPRWSLIDRVLRLFGLRR